MNQEVKKLWLDALRSGDYEQGREELRTEKDGSHQYCCLGVLCDIYHNTTGNGQWSHGFMDSSTFSNAQLVPEVRDWAGLNALDPRISATPAMRARVSLYEDIAGDDVSVSLLNDTHFTFAEIANIIEEQL